MPQIPSHTNDAQNEQRLAARRETQRRYRERCKASDPEGYRNKRKEQQAKYAAAHRSEEAKRRKAYYEKIRRVNLTDYQKARREYYTERYNSDTDFRIAQQQSHLLRKHLIGEASDDRFGYTSTDLKKHLEERFLPGMSWDNYGVWQIDHHIPITAFIREGIYSSAIISALENIKPMWASDNRCKGNTIPQDIPHPLHNQSQ